MADEVGSGRDTAEPAGASGTGADTSEATDRINGDVFGDPGVGGMAAQAAASANATNYGEGPEFGPEESNNLPGFTPAQVQQIDESMANWGKWGPRVGTGASLLTGMVTGPVGGLITGLVNRGLSSKWGGPTSAYERIGRDIAINEALGRHASAPSPTPGDAEGGQPTPSLTEISNALLPQLQATGSATSPMQMASGTATPAATPTPATAPAPTLPAGLGGLESLLGSNPRWASLLQMLQQVLGMARGMPGWRGGSLPGWGNLPAMPAAAPAAPATPPRTVMLTPGSVPSLAVTMRS